jgi:hypothetical protein
MTLKGMDKVEIIGTKVLLFTSWQQCYKKNVTLSEMSFLRRILIVFIFLFTSVQYTFCKDKIHRVDFDEKNPTEYVFNKSIDLTYKIISERLDYKDMILNIDKIKTLRPDLVKLYLEGQNIYDIFIWSVSVNNKSYLYYNQDNESVDYWVSFYLHLEKQMILTQR